MKKFKKIFAVLLTLAMVLGMGMTSFAEDMSATITVKNAGAGAKFQYLQVIKAEPTTETGWVFASEAIANNYKTAFTGMSEQEILKAMMPGGSATAAQIATALQNVKNSSYELSAETTSPITVNNAGVYYIEGSEENYTYNPMAAYISFGNYDTTTGVPASLVSTEVEAKRQTTKVEKTSDAENAVTEIGRTVNYTVKSVMPYVVAGTETNAKYIVKDKLTGAEYEKDDNGNVAVTIKIGSAVNTTQNIKVADDESFTIDLSSYLSNNQYANNDVTLTYAAIVTDVQVGNTVQIGNGQNGGDSYFGSDTDNSYTGEITLTKYASDGDNDDLEDNAKLAGAGFKVYKIDGANRKYATFNEGKLTGWVNAKADGTEITTNAQGTVNVKGLAAGTYYFEEVTAPTGYSINENPETVELVVNDDKKDNNGNATGTFNASGHMIDTTLSSLPGTGGIGTTIFTIGGCAIMIIAAALFFASRRKSAK